ncbi:hypothetical protein DPSP01_006683 [Paraphaeosphaeria sporulosa]
MLLLGVSYSPSPSPLCPTPLSSMPPLLPFLKQLKRDKLKAVLSQDRLGHPPPWNTMPLSPPRSAAPPRTDTLPHSPLFQRIRRTVRRTSLVHSGFVEITELTGSSRWPRSATTLQFAAV